MTKRCGKIPKELKAQILSQALISGCRIAELAKSYEIAPWTIHYWRKAALKKKSNIFDSSEFAIAPSINFIEALVEDHKDSQVNLIASHNLSSSSTLLKASFIFKHFSLNVKGSINRSRLLKAIEILEEPC